MGYANNNSVTIGEGLERYNVLAKINTRINRNIHLGLKVSGSLSKAEHPHTSIDVYEYAYNTSRAFHFGQLLMSCISMRMRLDVTEYCLTIS